MGGLPLPATSSDDQLIADDANQRTALAAVGAVASSEPAPRTPAGADRQTRRRKGEGRHRTRPPVAAVLEGEEEFDFEGQEAEGEETGREAPPADTARGRPTAPSARSKSGVHGAPRQPQAIAGEAGEEEEQMDANTILDGGLR